MARRRAIRTKDAQPLFPDHVGLLSLPGELRNQIYALCFHVEHSRVPLNPLYLNKPDQYIALARTCSQIYSEVRDYITMNQAAYILVMVGMNFDYEVKLEDEFGLPQGTNDTIAAALTDFADVHFHLHVDVIAGHDSHNPNLLIAFLRSAVEMFQSQSMSMFIRRGSKTRRRATVHLDHFHSLWPMLHLHHKGIRSGGTIMRLFELLAKDRVTDWEIRYYIPTKQANTRAQCRYNCLMYMVRCDDLAYMLECVHQFRHPNMAVVAEMYGEHTEWAYGDELGCVVRHRRTPATDFWPNVHYDPSPYDFERNWHLVKTYPTVFPDSNCDDEALVAARERRVRATCNGDDRYMIIGG